MPSVNTPPTAETPQEDAALQAIRQRYPKIAQAPERIRANALHFAQRVWIVDNARGDVMALLRNGAIDVPLAVALIEEIRQADLDADTRYRQHAAAVQRDLVHLKAEVAALLPVVGRNIVEGDYPHVRPPASQGWCCGAWVDGPQRNEAMPHTTTTFTVRTHGVARAYTITIRAVLDDDAAGDES